MPAHHLFMATNQKNEKNYNMISIYAVSKKLLNIFLKFITEFIN